MKLSHSLCACVLAASFALVGCGTADENDNAGEEAVEQSDVSVDAASPEAQAAENRCLYGWYCPGKGTYWTGSNGATSCANNCPRKCFYDVLPYQMYPGCHRK